MITLPYRLLRIRDTTVLLCLLCDRWSAHPDDILWKYCGYCHCFLTDFPEDFRSTEIPAQVHNLEQA
jgi:hypothetical protein